MNNPCLQEEVTPKQKHSLQPSRLPHHLNPPQSSICIFHLLPTMFRLYFYSPVTQYTEYCIASVVYYNTNFYLYNIMRKCYFYTLGEQQNSSQGQMLLRNILMDFQIKLSHRVLSGLEGVETSLIIQTVVLFPYPAHL